MTIRKFLELLACPLVLGACSSLSVYRESDCRQQSERYGSCFADLGYTDRGFTQLKKFCADHGIELKDDTFVAAKSARYKEICATPSSVFRQSFRSAIGVNGPEFCPEEMLSTPQLKKAQDDGRSAAFSYKRFESEAVSAKKAQARREDADRSGFWAGLWDRVFYSPEGRQKESDQAAADFKALLTNYPEANKPSLSEKLKCNADGWL